MLKILEDRLALHKANLSKLKRRKQELLKNPKPGIPYEVNRISAAVERITSKITELNILVKLASKAQFNIEKDPSVDEYVIMLSNTGFEDYYEVGDKARITKVYYAGEESPAVNAILDHDLYFVSVLPSSPFTGLVREAFKYPING